MPRGRTLAAVVVVVAALAMLTSACTRTDPPPAAAINRLVARCVDAMTRDACIAQRDRSAAPAASQVFVAGVGAIDAQAYGEIRAAGEAMCALVKERCNRGWNEPACHAARSIWPEPAATAR